MQRRRGSTALCIAASHGHSEIIRVLLQYGAQLESQDKVFAAAVASSLLLPPLASDISTCAVSVFSVLCCCVTAFLALVVLLLVCVTVAS